MAEPQHSATQPGPQSTGVADVPKAVDATEAVKTAVVHEAHEVDTFRKTPIPESPAILRFGLIASGSRAPGG